MQEAVERYGPARQPRGRRSLPLGRRRNFASEGVGGLLFVWIFE